MLSLLLATSATAGRPDILLGGVTPSGSPAAGLRQGADAQLAHRQSPSPLSTQLDALPGIAVEQRLARAHGLSVGDTVRLVRAPGEPETLFLVRALYRARPDPATALRGDYEARLHVADLAALRGAADRVDRFGVRAAAGVNADSLAAAINRTAVGYEAWPTGDIANESSRTFLVVSRFHRAIAFIAIAASAIFLLCVMLLKVEERRLDTAVLRMVGIGRRTVVRALLLEACLLSLFGAAVGVLLAWGAGLAINAIYQRRFETSLVFSFLTTDIVVLGVGVAVSLGLVVGAVAAGRLARVDPLVLWRRR